MYIIRALIRFQSYSIGKQINEAKEEEDRRIGGEYKECICQPIGFPACVGVCVVGSVKHQRTESICLV